MTIEQVTFTDLQEVSVKIKTSNKGRKTGPVTNPMDLPAPSGDTGFIKKNAGDIRKSQTTQAVGVATQ